MLYTFLHYIYTHFIHYVFDLEYFVCIYIYIFLFIFKYIYIYIYRLLYIMFIIVVHIIMITYVYINVVDICVYIYIYALIEIVCVCLCVYVCLSVGRLVCLSVYMYVIFACDQLLCMQRSNMVLTYCTLLKWFKISVLPIWDDNFERHIFVRLQPTSWDLTWARGTLCHLVVATAGCKHNAGVTFSELWQLRRQMTSGWWSHALWPIGHEMSTV